VILAALHKVEKFYGEQTVLDGVTLELRTGERTALIGRNGAGKSTILRLLSGADTPDGGRTFRREDVALGVLEQDGLLDEAATIAEVASAAFVELDRLERDLQTLEAAGLEDPARYERWEALHERFERRGGYARRARRDAVLHALGFARRADDSVRHLSGGERTRLGLARLLMAQPDALLLDEPTNHLDVDMRAWLESFLARYPGAALVVSHDRAFLDAACNRTVEVVRGRLDSYDAPPTEYRVAMAEQRAIEARTRANQEREHGRITAAAEQMRKWAGQNAKLHRRARSMERRRDRYQEGMIDAPEGPERSTRFQFESDPSGDIVITADHLAKAFDGRTLFDGVSQVVRTGERIGLVGPNGAGKTTFLRVLLGELSGDDPRASVRFGARVRVGYYDQELRGVDPASTLIEEMIRLTGDVEAHNLLGRFLFPYDAQYKRIADLSGGERARLALLKLTMGRNNLLVLDEPTNHLDVEMIEALEEALAAFEGTLLLVSHDRRFLDAVADTIWEVRDGRFTAYDGDWEHYVRKRRARREAGRTSGKPREQERPRASERSGPSRWQLERELEALEGRIGLLEAELDHLGSQLADPDALELHQLAEVGERHAAREDELLTAMQRWEEISATLEAFQG
jgi:ATP-binding cassette subfamily F protein 3